MLDLSKLPLFLLAALVLLLTPGPAVLYIVARSLDQGRLAGLVSVLSIEIGNFVHVLAATLGLSALLLSSSMAFSIVNLLAGTVRQALKGARPFLGTERYLVGSTYIGLGIMAAFSDFGNSK